MNTTSGTKPVCLGPHPTDSHYEVWRSPNGRLLDVIATNPAWPEDLKAALRVHRTAVLVGVCSCGGSATGPVVAHQPSCPAAEIPYLLSRYGIQLGPESE
jgi:hypothetical protein